MRVSVVIPCLDEPRAVLENLKNQAYRDFEVIVVNDKGFTNAMIHALEIAKGDIFVRIDDDVHLLKNWLVEIVKCFDNPLVAGVTGPTYVPPERRQYRDSISNLERIYHGKHNFLRWLLIDYLFEGKPFAPAKIYKCGSVSYGSNFQEFIDKDKEYHIDHLEGTNWAMRTELIRQVGGFDPKFDGVCQWVDDDVVFKIKKLGYGIVYNPKAYLWHLVGKGSHYNERFQGWDTLRNFIRFHSRHSRFNFRMLAYFMFMCAYYINHNLKRK